MPLTQNFATLMRLMTYRPYRAYTIGNSASLIGTWMQRVTVGWLAWELTGSSAWVGAIGFADLFPTILIGLFAGAAADRMDIIWLLRITQVLGFAHAALMVVLHLLGLLTIWPLLLITLSLGAVTGFVQPARLSIVSSFVPRADIGSAVAMNALAFNLARFVGPACAGLLIAVAGVGWAFGANALSYLVFVAAIRDMPSVPSAARPGRRSVLGDISEGLAYAGRSRGVLAVLSITVAMALGARPAVELLPAFAGGVLGLGASGLAALTSAVGIGALFGGTWMVGRAAASGLPRLCALMASASAGSVLLLCLVDSLWLALPILTAMGAAMVCTGISSQVLIQLSVAERVRGRVLSLWGLLQRGVPALSALAVGAAGELAGLRLALAAAAALLLGAALVMLVRAPAIARDLERT